MIKYFMSNKVILNSLLNGQQETFDQNAWKDKIKKFADFFNHS